jgi:hypothetical protein
MSKMNVTCVALGHTEELLPNYPTGATVEQIAEVDSSVRAWFEDYRNGEVFFLSAEAIDKGFRFFSTLEIEERPEFRFVKELGGDVLCRHSRWFVNPADAKDLRMTDGLEFGKPVNRRGELLAQENADKVKVPRITVDPS